MGIDRNRLQITPRLESHNRGIFLIKTDVKTEKQEGNNPDADGPWVVAITDIKVAKRGPIFLHSFFVGMSFLISGRENAILESCCQDLIRQG